MSWTRAMTHGKDMPGCVRRLINMERIFLTGPTSCIASAARVTGDVSQKDLMRALDCVRRMHPLVGAKVVFDGDGDAWFSTDGVPGTALRTVPRTSETRWIDEVRQEILMPFDFEAGPLIRFVLVYSPEVSELVVYCHHCISDGVAVINLFRDILVFYSDPGREIHILLPPAVTDCARMGEKRPLSRYGRSISISSYNRQWRKKRNPLSLKDFYEIIASFWEKNRPGLSMLQLDPEETKDLVSRCRENGVTMVSAISAAFVLARQEVMVSAPEEDSLIGVSFDLRKRVGEDIGDVFCYFADGAILSISNNQKSFWDLARNIHNDFKKLMNVKNDMLLDIERLDQTLIDAVFGVAPYICSNPEVAGRTQSLSAFAGDPENIAFRLRRKWSSRSPCAIIANMGRSSIPEIYGNLRLCGLYSLSPASQSIQFVIGGSGVGGGLTMCINYLEKRNEEGQSFARDVIRMRNRMLQHFGFPEKANDKAV